MNVPKNIFFSLPFYFSFFPLVIMLAVPHSTKLHNIDNAALQLRSTGKNNRSRAA